MSSWVAVIPARGGSKSIPHKNIKEFLGKPLLAWTIEVARDSGLFNRVLLSTDDPEIARAGKEFGAEAQFLRPAELAQDTTLTAPVIRHALEWVKSQGQGMPEFVMVLEPTSPARQTFHLREAAALLEKSGADSVASVSELPHHYSPSKILKLEKDGSIAGIDGTPIHKMIHRRQDLPLYYAFDSGLFSCKMELVLSDPPTLWGKRVLGYRVDPKYSVDLDSLEDWVPAEEKVRQLFQEERRLKR